MSAPTPTPAFTDEQIDGGYTAEGIALQIDAIAALWKSEYGDPRPVFDLIAAVIDRAKREEREASGAQAIYVVQEWVEADGIHDGWNTAYGYFTNSRADAEGTLEHLRKTHRDTEFRLVVATRSDWTEATDDETR